MDQTRRPPPGQRMRAVFGAALYAEGTWTEKHMMRARLGLALAMLLMGLEAPAAIAADYPTRTVNLVVPLAPGGVADLVARLVATGLQKQLGKPVIVVNRPGGGGGIGAASVAHSSPDGHTLLLALSPVIAVPELDRVSGQSPQYELSELAPLARLTAEPFVVVVQPDAPWKTFAELVDDARKRPNEVSYASSGERGSIHFAMELVSRATGASFLHVPYRGGGPAVTALLSREVGFTMASPAVGVPFVSKGRLRAIAYSGGERPPNYPGLASFKEQGIEAEYLLWSGLYAPVKTPADVQARILGSLRAVFADPEFQTAALGAGLTLAYMDEAQFRTFQAREVEEIGGLAKRLGKI
jgi:tripartite-type tricarboxylate transporter receptor subunit TctC